VNRQQPLARYSPPEQRDGARGAKAIYTFLSVVLHLLSDLSTCVHLYMCMYYIYIYVRVCVCVHIYIHIYIYIYIYMYTYTYIPMRYTTARHHGRARPPGRRIHQGYFRDVFPTVIFALGYLWGWVKTQFNFRVKSLPGDHPKPSSGPILDPTAGLCWPERFDSHTHLYLYLYLYLSIYINLRGPAAPYIYICIYVYIYICI